MARVLVADDEAAIRDVIAQTCDLDGHEAVRVATLDEALASYRERRPDLLILDINMPGGGAAAILAGIESRGEPVCPVVVVSGFAEEDEVDHPKVVETLQKPFGIDAMRIAIRTALATDDPAGQD